MYGSGLQTARNIVSPFSKAKTLLLPQATDKGYMRRRQSLCLIVVLGRTAVNNSRKAYTQVKAFS